MKVLLLGFLYVLVNLPFGYLRAGVSKETPKRLLKKLLYIHLPIPFVYGLRHFVFKISLKWLPFLFVCYALGQWGGGKLRQRASRG